MSVKLAWAPGGKTLLALGFYAGVVPAGEDKWCIIQRKALMMQAADIWVSPKPAGINLTHHFLANVSKSALDQCFVPWGCGGFSSTLVLPLGAHCQAIHLWSKEQGHRPSTGEGDSFSLNLTNNPAGFTGLLVSVQIIGWVSILLNRDQTPQTTHINSLVF